MYVDYSPKCIQMRDEKEERKKQARSNKRTNKAKQHSTHTCIYKMYVPLSALVHSCLGDHDTPSKVRRWRGGIIWKSSRLPFSAVEPHKIRGRRNGELLDHPLVHPTLILLHMRAHTEIHGFLNER